MRLERHTPLEDNIFRIEPVSEREYADIRFYKKINRMEREALDKIKSLVDAAKDGIYPKLRLNTSEFYGLGYIGALYSQQLQQLGSYGARQARNPFFGGLGGIFGF